MSLSTNSVIHYTNKLENLLSIITEQSFKIKYCTEDLNFIIKKDMDLAINMVCFCDIPLSEVKNHIDSYGSYGIGLTKLWARKNGLNPVLYVEKDSILSKTLSKQFARYMNLDLDKDYSSHERYIDEFFEICKYIKQYEGPLKSGKLNEENYRFYNEREWRYSLDNATCISKNIPGILIAKDYLVDKDASNSKFDLCRLKFEINDISYFIIDDESEIPTLLKYINDNFETKCTAQELKILSTKILTKNQICNDF